GRHGRHADARPHGEHRSPAGRGTAAAAVGPIHTTVYPRPTAGPVPGDPRTYQEPANRGGAGRGLRRHLGDAAPAGGGAGQRFSRMTLARPTEGLLALVMLSFPNSRLGTPCPKLYECEQRRWRRVRRRATSPAARFDVTPPPADTSDAGAAGTASGGS